MLESRNFQKSILSKRLVAISQNQKGIDLHVQADDSNPQVKADDRRIICRKIDGSPQDFTFFGSLGKDSSDNSVNTDIQVSICDEP
jgi:hypothetical protein